MHESLAVIAKHGYVVLFAWITAEQLGAPVPAIPILIAAGVLSATGQFTFAGALALGVLGCLIGDTVWYVLGRRNGATVLRVLCKISLNPETCVRRSSEFISRNGSKALVFAKFIPGVGGVAIPLAATAGMSIATFALFDIAGCFAYVGAYLAAGRLLGDRIDKLSVFAGSVRNIWLLLAILGALCILGWRIYRKRQFESAAGARRIAPEELLQLLEKKPQPYIVDLRHPLDMLTDARVIPGAIRMTPDELSTRHSELPREQEIILYCT